MFKFILEYNVEAATSIYTNRCRTNYLRRVYICNSTDIQQGAAL